MLVFAVSFTALLSYAFDAVRLNNYSLGWLPVNIISLSAAVLLVVLVVRLAQRFNLAAQSRAQLNLVLASVAMGTKNVATLLLCPVFGIEDSGSLFFRFIGGAAIGVSILLIYSNLRGAKIEHQLIMADLLQKENELIGYRENITDIFAEQEKEIAERTATALLPRLLAIQEKITLGQDGISLATDFEQMLTQDVKPLSSSLAEQANELKLALPVSKKIKPSELDVRINLAKSIKPISSSLLAFFAWWMIAQVVIPEATLLDIVIATVIFQAILFLIQLLVRSVKDLPVNQALWLLPLPGLIASLPNYILLYQIPHDNGKVILLPTFLVIGGWACISMTIAYILERGRAVAEEKLTQLVNQVSRENKLFQQRLWIAQHVWYTLLHGSVQSALSAGAIRASDKKELSSIEAQALQADLDRAIQALKEPRLEAIDFNQCMTELQQTWSGICEITYDLSPDTLKAISNNSDARLVANEVIKEAVSNAIKHAQASKVIITLKLNQDSDLLLTVENDGSAPSSASVHGVGSKIFESVCLSFSLKRNPDTELTIFTAVIPLA